MIKDLKAILTEIMSNFKTQMSLLTISSVFITLNIFRPYV
jgi:hypothetical protein